MKALFTLVKDWFIVKTAKNPSPELERKIEEKRRELHDQVTLLRLSNAELINRSKNLRFEVMEDLVNDIARYKRR